MGPMFYVVLAKGLKVLSKVNILLKYAYDTTLLVSNHSDVELADELENVKHCGLNIIECFLISQRPKRLSLDVPPQNCFFSKFSSPD